MSFERLKDVSEQVISRLPAVRGKGEQATKQALVLPVLDALGYDVWNPAEVCPEFDADFAVKKAGQKEKVDIAILLGGQPRVYIETKSIDEPLDGHEGQLARYFNATQSVTLGVLTNGVEWRFFTDTGDPNVMDAQPFHLAKLDAADQGLEVVVRFARSVFSADAIRDYATELRYTAQIAAFLRQQLDLKDREPNEYFMRWVLKADRMYDGVVNANVLDRFRPITKDALTRVIREIVRRSIRAMEQEAAQPGTMPEAAPPQAMPPVAEFAAECGQAAADEDAADVTRRGIETTERELSSFAVVRELFEQSELAGAQIYDSASRRAVPVSLSYKDTTGYFGIYLNRPSWWAIRLHIEGRTNWIGFNIDEGKGTPMVPSDMVRLDAHPFAGFRVEISSPEDITRLQPLVLAAFEKTIRDRDKGKGATGEPA